MARARDSRAPATAAKGGSARLRLLQGTKGLGLARELMEFRRAIVPKAQCAPTTIKSDRLETVNDPLGVLSTALEQNI